MNDNKDQSLDGGSDPVSSTEKTYDNGYASHDGHAEHGEIKTVQLKRKLQSRHLQMIAIGGTIGTGLFIGSGGALATSG